MLDRIAVPDPRGIEPRLTDARVARSWRAGPPAAPIVRRIPGGVAASLEALPDEALPRLDIVGTGAALRPRLRAAVAGRLPRPRWLANWLADDALGLVAALVELSGAAPLRVAFGPGDPAPATDAGLRLVAVYRGPEIAWRGEGARRLAAGEVAVLSGRDAGSEMVRRAPRPGEGAGLCLVVDALVPRSRQSAKSRVSTPSQSRST